MVKSEQVFYLGDDRGCQGCRRPLPFGCFVNVRPAFLHTHPEAHEPTCDAKLTPEDLKTG